MSITYNRRRYTYPVDDKSGRLIWMVITNDLVMRSDQVSDKILCRTVLVDTEKESDVCLCGNQVAHCGQGEPLSD